MILANPGPSTQAGIFAGQPSLGGSAAVPQERGNVSTIPDGKFRKSEHLLKSKEFQTVYNKGRSSRNDYIILYYIARNTALTRIGFAISSRKIRLATTRNRLKRLLREAFRRSKGRLKSGHDLVVAFSRAPRGETTYSEIEEKFLKVAAMSGLIL